MPALNNTSKGHEIRPTQTRHTTSPPPLPPTIGRQVAKPLRITAKNETIETSFCFSKLQPACLSALLSKPNKHPSDPTTKISIQPNLTSPLSPTPLPPPCIKHECERLNKTTPPWLNMLTTLCFPLLPSFAARRKPMRDPTFLSHTASPTPNTVHVTCKPDIRSDSHAWPVILIQPPATNHQHRL